MKSILAKETSNRPDLTNRINSVLYKAMKYQKDSALSLNGLYDLQEEISGSMRSIAVSLGFGIGVEMFDVYAIVTGAYVGAYSEKHGNLLFALDRENGEIDYLIY